MKTVTIILGVLLPITITFGQFVRGPINSAISGVLDGVYIAEHVPTKKVIAYPYIREADVTWSKRVWSVIDLREKFNHPLYYPLDDIQGGEWNKNSSHWSLWTIIRYHVLAGDLTAYSPFNPNWEAWTDGDSFKYPIKPTFLGGNYGNDSLFREAIFMYLGVEEIDPFVLALVSVLDPTIDSVDYDASGNPFLVYPPSDTSWFLSQDIVEYKLKEDWFFDKNRSTLERRILGIAPVIYQRNSAGMITGKRELFWLYFPECRYVFQNYYLQNRKNNGHQLSLDDLFWKRMFHSYILKESNPQDRPISDYSAGIDALLESERIKQSVANFEHDLFSY